MPEWIAFVVPVLLLLVAILAWRTAVNAVRAVAFTPRHEIYLDVKKFVQDWATHARPQMNEISRLDTALESARFLFSPKVVRYLEKLREASFAAHKAEQILTGEIAGDKQKARETSARLCV